jgi:hypothetical protein
MTKQKYLPGFKFKRKRGATAGTGRRKRARQESINEWVGRIFDDETERQTDAALIAVSQNPENPKMVRAAALLKAYKHGSPPQMVRQAGEDEFRAALDRIAKSVEDAMDDGGGIQPPAGTGPDPPGP